MERCRVPKYKSAQSCVSNWMPYRKMKQWPWVTEIGGEVIAVLGGTLICLKPEQECHKKCFSRLNSLQQESKTNVKKIKC